MGAILGEQRKSCKRFAINKARAYPSPGQPSATDKASTTNETSQGRTAPNTTSSAAPALSHPMTAPEPHRFADRENQSKPKTP